jgi:hypothetical protein
LGAFSNAFSNGSLFPKILKFSEFETVISGCCVNGTKFGVELNVVLEAIDVGFAVLDIHTVDKKRELGRSQWSESNMFLDMRKKVDVHCVSIVEGNSKDCGGGVEGN